MFSRIMNLVAGVCPKSRLTYTILSPPQAQKFTSVPGDSCGDSGGECHLSQGNSTFSPALEPEQSPRWNQCLDPPSLETHDW